MAKIVEYSSTRQQNIARFGTVESSSDDLDKSYGEADYIREELLNEFGWQSPSEYYYGGSDSELSGKPSEAILTAGEIQEFYDKEEFSVQGPADKSIIPDWFWVDSLDNWCYFKITDDMTEFKKTSPRFGVLGNAAISFMTKGLIRVIDKLASGDFTGAGLQFLKNVTLVQANEDVIDITNGVTEKITDIMSAVSHSIFGDTVLGRALSVLSSNQLVVPLKMLSTAAYLYNTMSLPKLLYVTLLSSTSLDHEDVEAEDYPEELATGSTDYNMPRNCISLYMWNGYKRNWTPVKTMFEIYERYGKRSSRELVTSSLKIIADQMMAADDTMFNQYLQLYGIIVEGTTGEFEDLKRRAFEYKRTSTSSIEFIAKMTDLILSYPQAVNALSRMLFLKLYYFDPKCFEAFESRSLLNKKHVFKVDNGDSHSWAQGHWLENWSMWIPLPREKCKVKLYSKNTYQLMNRAFYPLSWCWRDLVGFEHKNIGHPCFMRGNDDVLWMCYWQRWTSTRGSEEYGGGIMDKTITVGGVQDIYKVDVDNWTAIRESMFEKHDDYGFDDWMINGNYLLSNHRFTIDEEVPSDVSTYRESSIAPDRIAPVISVEDVETASLTLTLSNNTIVSRDDDNRWNNAAKRWR